MIGCSIAYQLARNNVPCAVLDRSELGREASWASAGILTHGNPGSRSAYGRLATGSRALFPQLVEELERLTGIEIDYRPSGGLHLFFEDADLTDVRTYHEQSVRNGVACNLLTSEELRQLEPALSPECVCGLQFAEDASLRPHRFTRALAQAAAQLGAELMPHTPALGFEQEGDQITGVMTPCGVLRAATFVLSAGAWSEEVGASIGLTVPVRPSKGQVVLLETTPLLVRHVIHAGDYYLVPRSDGRLIIGATVEDAGFDKSPTAHGLQTLIDWACRVVPRLRDTTFVTTWCGLRPASADGLLLGRAPGIANLILATGHNRNGILLAPITGVRVCEWVLDSRLSP